MPVDPPSSPPPTATRRASVIGTVVALIVLGGIAWLAWSLTRAEPAPTRAPPGAAAGPRGAPPTTVGIAAAGRADLPVVLEALGTVTPTATSTVRPRVSGVLKDVRFREGQMVKAGQLLATLDPQPFEMQLLQATGQRMKDEAQLENAKLTLERYRKLLALDSIARQEVDTQAALVRQLEATVVASRAAEGAARLDVGYTKITAPISGRVGLRVVDAGNLVASNDAEGIAVITQLAPIDVEFAIPQDDLQEVQRRATSGDGLPVEALDRSRAAVLDRGTFLSLDNQVDVQTGTVRAKARFPNAGSALFPGQFVNVRLLLRTIRDAVVVPVAALRHGTQGDFVYVVDTGARRVSVRGVERGRQAADRVEIVKGLQPGEVVVTEGADRLRDGARVVLPGADRPPAGDGAAARAGDASGAAAKGSRRPPASGAPRAEAGASR